MFEHLHPSSGTPCSWSQGIQGLGMTAQLQPDERDELKAFPMDQKFLVLPHALSPEGKYLRDFHGNHGIKPYIPVLISTTEKNNMKCLNLHPLNKSTFNKFIFKVSRQNKTCRDLTDATKSSRISSTTVDY